MNTEALFSSKNEVWATPQDFFDKLNEEFHFTLDPCSLPENAKCKKYYTPKDDGLKQNWGGEKVFYTELHDTEHPFPITSEKVRKYMGEALIKTLTEDKRSLERFLLSDYKMIRAKAVERNKKGQVTRVIITIE